MKAVGWSTTLLQDSLLHALQVKEQAGHESVVHVHARWSEAASNERPLQLFTAVSFEDTDITHEAVLPSEEFKSDRPQMAIQELI